MRSTLASTQLYVWTQVLGRTGKRLEDQLDSVLGEVRAAGYPAFEGYLSFFESADQTVRVKDALARHGLKMPSVYTGGNLYDPAQTPGTIDRIVNLASRAAALGVVGITMNPDVLRDGKTDEQLARQADALNTLGRRLRETHVELWIHNHDPEMQRDGREVHSNLDRTDPALVGFCADVHWIWRGGGDPYAYLEKYGSRLGNLHLRNSRSKIWSEEFGEGDLDYPRVARILKKQRFRGPLIVELAIEEGTPQTRPLVESQKLSRAYLNRVFGV